MNKIEEQIHKFETIKQKIPPSDWSELTNKKSPFSISLLTYFIKKKSSSSHKNQTNNIFIPNPNITENPSEQKPNEKHKFILQKPNEKVKNKTQSGKSHGNNADSGQNNKGYANKNYDFAENKLNLLDIENKGMTGSELKKLLQKNREEEEKIEQEKKINEAKEAGKKETEPEKKEKEDIDDMSFDSEEIEKNNKPNFQEMRNVSMNLRPAESGINIPANFNIFDKSKINEEEYGNFPYEDNNYIEDKNKDTSKKDDIKEENNSDSEKSKEKEELKISTQVIEKKGNNLKLILSIDEDENEKNNKPPSKQNKVSKTSKITSTKKNISSTDKLLQHKTNRNTSNENKKSINNNKPNKIINYISNSMAPINKTKVILDEEDEEIIKEKANILNENKNNVPMKIDEEPIVKKDGNKFTLLFDPNELKDIDKKGTDNDNNSTGKKSKQKKKQEFNINIEIETENKTQNNNNKDKNIINKNKNGAQNSSQKNNPLSQNYDLSCLENIHDIIKQIKDKLEKDSQGKKIIDKCLDLIIDNKTNKKYINNLTKRKKDTYTNVSKILVMLFNYFYEKKESKNYVNEMIAILTHVEKYYKLVKKYDYSINEDKYFYKRKIAFKYAFSKLELRNNEIDDIKKLYIKNEKDNTYTVQNIDKTIKLIKIYKRFIRTSAVMNKELKIFKDKLSNSIQTQLIKDLLEKYLYCPADIQMTSNLMSFGRLFKHCSLIFSFYDDFDDPTLLKELEEKKKKENNQVNDFRKKGKSMQIKKNGIHEKRDISVNSVKMKNNK